MKNRCLSVVLFLFTTFFFMITGIESVEAQEMSVSGEGRFKSFMPMTALSKSSPQYRYLADNTYDQDNLRVTYDGYFAVAMGSYYGVLGDKFIITFGDGTRTPVVKVDEKADRHTVGGNGMTMISDGSIIEPIITTSSVNNSSRPDLMGELYKWGTAGMVYPEFAQDEKIISIEKVIGDAPNMSEKPEYIKENTSTADGGSLEEGISTLFITDREQDKMIMYFPDIFYNKLVFLDTEFSERQELVQAAFIVYEKIGDKDLFFLTSSLNVYVNAKVSPEFEKFTGITRGFLGNEGLPKEDAEKVINSFIDSNNLNGCNALIVGHGVQQDLDVLYQSGCELSGDVYDTLQQARVLLNKERKLKLSDLLLDAGLVQENAHDAYQDTRNLVPIFSHLVWVDFNKNKRYGER